MNLTEEQILDIFKTQHCRMSYCGHCANNSETEGWNSKIIHVEQFFYNSIKCTVLLQCPKCKKYTIYIFEIQEVRGEYLVNYQYFCSLLDTFNILSNYLKTYCGYRHVPIADIVQSAIKNFLAYVCYKYQPRLLRKLDIADTSSSEVNFNVTGLLPFVTNSAEDLFLRFVPRLTSLSRDANGTNIATYILKTIFEPSILNIQEHIEV